MTTGRRPWRTRQESREQASVAGAGTAYGLLIADQLAEERTNLPLRYREPTARGLAKLVDARFWAVPAKIGELRVAELQVALIAAMRSANNLKVRLLIFAIAAELIAIIFLFWAVAVILYHA